MCSKKGMEVIESCGLVTENAHMHAAAHRISWKEGSANRLNVV